MNTYISARESDSIIALARAMADPDFDAATPDKFDALVAVWDYDRACRIWQRACESFDWHHSPEEFPDGRPAHVEEYR